MYDNSSVIKEAFEKAYPTIPWIDNPTELATRQMAFMRGWSDAMKNISSFQAHYPVDYMISDMKILA